MQKCQFKEAQHLAAELRRIAVERRTPGRTLGADALIRESLLAAILFAQHLLIVGALALEATREHGVQQQGRDNRQFGLIGNSDRRLAPGFGHSGVVLPVVRRLLLFLAPAMAEGDDADKQAESLLSSSSSLSPRVR